MTAPTPIGYRTGCKVAWDYYATEADAQAAAVKAREDAADKWALGYDFGYQVPGGIRHIAAHPEHGECWEVCIP